MYTKLVPETVYYIKFIKLYLQSFVSIYNFINHLFVIIYKSTFLHIEHNTGLLVH